MINPFWKPKGRRLLTLEELCDGLQVQAIAFPHDRRIRRKIKDGVIRFVHDDWLDGGASIFLVDCRTGWKTHLGYQNSDGSFSDKFDDMDSVVITIHNKVKEQASMANKLMALVRLNKNQRKLAKAGIYDENGNLTANGQEVLLNLLAKDNEAQLVDLVKDWKDDKKDKDSDDE